MSNSTPFSSSAGPSGQPALPLIRATDIRRYFRMGDSTVEVLKGVDLAIRAGEFVAIEGRSGSGKSTMLHVLGALDGVDAGSTEVGFQKDAGSLAGPLAPLLRFFDSIFGDPKRRRTLSLLAHVAAIIWMFLIVRTWRDRVDSIPIIPRVLCVLAGLEILQVFIQLATWRLVRRLALLNRFLRLLTTPKDTTERFSDLTFENYARPTTGSRGGPLAPVIGGIDSVFELPSRRWSLHLAAHLFAIVMMLQVKKTWGDPYAELPLVPYILCVLASLELIQIFFQIGIWLLARLLSVLNWCCLVLIDPIEMTVGAARMESRASRLRSTDFGFVFQFYHLLPELNVLQNTLLPAMVQRWTIGYFIHRRAIMKQALAQLDRVGLSHRLKHLPSQLSGGERQRVAIARALMNNPRVLLADEPTGNLDAETGRQIMDLLEKLHRDQGQTIVMVTHDRALAREADRVLVLKNGQLERAEA